MEARQRYDILLRKYETNVAEYEHLQKDYEKLEAAYLDHRQESEAKSDRLRRERDYAQNSRTHEHQKSRVALQNERAKHTGEQDLYERMQELRTINDKLREKIKSLNKLHLPDPSQEAQLIARLREQLEEQKQETEKSTALFRDIATKVKTAIKPFQDMAAAYPWAYV